MTQNKTLLYVLTGCAFCVMVAVVATGVSLAETTTCGVQSLTLDREGKQLKAWSRGTKSRCALFSYGCEALCKSQCEKLLTKMAEAEKKDAPNTGAAVFKYRCQVSMESQMSDEEKNRPNLTEGEIPLR